MSRERPSVALEFELEEVENFLATFFEDGAGKMVHNPAHRQAVLVKFDHAVEEARRDKAGVAD